MGEIIATTEIPREIGWLYYCGTDSKGNLTVCKAQMTHNGRAKKKSK